MKFDGLSKAFMFEKVVGKIISLGYNLNSDVKNDNFGFDYLTSNGVKLEVKYNSKNDFYHFLLLIRNLYAHQVVDKENLIFVTNTSAYLEDYTDDCKRMREIIDKFTSNNLHIISLENLLFLCQDDEELKTELLSCLDFSTESILPMPLDESILEMLKGAGKTTYESTPPTRIKFIDELKVITAGNRKRASTKYEVFCKRFVSTIFQNNIDVPKSQVTNNKGMHRFDIIASLKDNPASFWKFIYEKYNSCFILFECKNYREQIGQEQIYLTEKYLFDKALRNVAIIFTRAGADKNAHLATQDILKEHGKLILILEDKDIEKLEEYFDNENLSPSEYLLEKTKAFLMDINK